MTTSNAKERFQEANRNLIVALENLEKIAIAKIHDTSLQSNMFHLGEGESSSLKAQIVSQTATIQNLNQELNKLQEENLSLTTENENLAQQNQSLLKKINKLRQDSENIIDDIQADLLKVSKIVEKQ